MSRMSYSVKELQEMLATCPFWLLVYPAGTEADLNAARLVLDDTDGDQSPPEQLFMTLLEHLDADEPVLLACRAEKHRQLAMTVAKKMDWSLAIVTGEEKLTRH